MNRTKRATWVVLVLSAVGGVMGQACSSEEENTDRNGETDALKGGCALAADDGDPCTLEGCEGLPNAHVPTAGLPCGVGGALTCDAGGACVGCATPDQCGSFSECAPWKCESAVCSKVSAPEGTPLMTQSVGDCKKEQCDGNGGVATVNDDMDPPNKACQITSCANGTPMSAPAAQGTPCTVGNGKSCDGMGNCVECITDADCGQIDFFCDPNSKTCFSCKDGIKNGDESDIDCGGAKCNDCPQGKKCNVVQDCVAPNLCADGVCCNALCDGPCLACDLANNLGKCKGVEKYGEDPAYGSGMSCLNSNGLACSGAGACGKILGASCVADPDCASFACGDPDANGQNTCVKNTGETCSLPVECNSNNCMNGVCAP